MSHDDRSSDPRDRDARATDELAAGQRLLSQPLRSAVLGELSPTRDRRQRVQTAIGAALGRGTVSPLVKQVDEAMAARAARLKTASVVAGKTLAGKAIVATVVVASAAALTTGLVLHERLLHQTPVAQQRSRRVPSTAEVHARDEATTAVPNASTSGRASAPSLSAAVDAPQPVAVSDEGSHARAASNARARLRAPRVSPRRAASHEPAAPPSAASEAPSEPAAPPASAPTASQPSAAPSEPAAPPDPAPTASQPSAAPSEPAAAASEMPTLADELALVRGASDALARNDPATALKLLARHATTYPKGALAIEADALRAIALCAAKRPDAARARDLFLRAHGTSALANRVRSACR